LPDSSKKAESQVQKFREAARELETDDSEANFDRVLKKVAKSLRTPKEDNAAKKTDK